jgi:hypothetical protein
MREFTGVLVQAAAVDALGAIWMFVQHRQGFETYRKAPRPGIKTLGFKS